MFLEFLSLGSFPLKETICGTWPFFYSISPLPILIFMLALASDCMGGVVALLLLLMLAAWFSLLCLLF